MRFQGEHCYRVDHLFCSKSVMCKMSDEVIVS
jgi:hypothetical protein